MAYKNPESKREGCYYPNCSGYLEVPFCCQDPKALPALKAARLAQLETPKREWVGLSVNEARDFFESKLTRSELITEISEFLEEKNGA